VNPCHSTWKCLRALQTRVLRKTRVVGKVYNICRVNTDILALLTVKSGLHPHMIIELKGDLNWDSLFILLLSYLFYSFKGWYILTLSYCLLNKIGSTKMLIVVKLCQLILDFGLACHIIYSTYWVPTISVLILALLKPMLLRTR
jgi:hypothetical protein